MITTLACVLAVLGWAAVAGLALAIAAGDCRHQIGRAEVEDALDVALDDQEALVDLIAASRDQIDVALNAAAVPGRDTDLCMDILFGLVQTGPLSQDAVDAILQPEVDIIAGEAVEVP